MVTGPNVPVTFMCKACGSKYDERNNAVRCFENHTKQLGEMVVEVVGSGVVIAETSDEDPRPDKDRYI